MYLITLMLQSFPAESRRGGTSRVTELLRKADELCDVGELREAIDLYDIALDIEANEIICNNKGVALDSLKEHELAVESYDMAIGLREDYVTAWHNKANSLRYMGRYDEAIECYDKVISLDPSNEQPYFDKAEAYIEASNYRKAKKAAEEGVRMGKGDRIELLMKKGKIFNDAGDFIGALGVYDEALAFEENNFELWKLRGDTLLNLGRYKEAYDTYESILSYSQDEEVWNNKGYVLFSMGNYSEAVKCYKRAIEIAPNFSPVHYNLAYLYHTKGDYKKAVEHYKKAAKGDKENEVLWNNLGNALYNMSKYEDSLPYFVKALEVNPDYHIAWNNIGNVLDKLGKHDEAVEYHERAIKISPDMDYYHYALGHALAKIGKMEEGLEEVNISLDLNSNYEKALFVKADILRMLGRVDECLETIDEILKINLHFAEAWKMRGRILEEYDKYEESRLSYEEALKAYEKNFKRFNDISSLLSKGALLEEVGRLEEALETYDKLLDLSDHDEVPWIKKINMHLELNDFREAVVAANQALERFDTYELYILRGKGYEEMGNYEKAEISYSKALEMDGADARIAFARYLADDEEYEKALDVLEDENWEEKLLKANIQLEFGLLEDTELIFRELLVEKSSSLRAWFGLGQALAKKGETKAAMNAFDTCIGISEEFEPAWYHKAMLYMQQGKEKKAVLYARTALSIANGAYKDAEEILERLEGETSVDDVREEDFQKNFWRAKEKLVEVRKFKINIDPLKKLMEEAKKAGELGDFQKGIELAEEMIVKLDRIKDIHTLFNEAKGLITEMKDAGIEYGEYISELKGVKNIIAEGNYNEAINQLTYIVEQMENEIDSWV